MKAIEEYVPPCIELMKGWRKLRLKEVYTIGIFHRQVRIPEGFVSDGASVPWIFSRLVPRMYGTAGAALIHDAVYRQKGHYGLTRKQADDAFRELMVLTGNSRIRATLAWFGVRAGGGFAWRR